jgi:hypothetical protein
MLTAMMAVWNMMGAGHDIWEVNTDYEYHEEQRVDTRSLDEKAGDVVVSHRLGAAVDA